MSSNEKSEKKKSPTNKILKKKTGNLLMVNKIKSDKIDSISMNNFTQSIAQSGTPFRMNFEVSNFSPGLGDNFNAWPTNASRRRWIHKLILPVFFR